MTSVRMMLSPPSEPDLFSAFMQNLEMLFQEMDAAYDAASRQYGFFCQGCVDTCCETRFYHHTLLEYLYLKAGLRTFSPKEQDDILALARKVNLKMAEADAAGHPVRMLCPLNQDGRCRMYAYRPMICRLHGIAHELRQPDGKIIRQPGCDAFFNHCRENGKTSYIPFDRTRFYRQMAALEKALRQETGYGEKIRMTISQILVSP